MLDGQSNGLCGGARAVHGPRLARHTSDRRALSLSLSLPIGIRAPFAALQRPQKIQQDIPSLWAATPGPLPLGSPARQLSYAHFVASRCQLDSVTTKLPRTRAPSSSSAVAATVRLAHNTRADALSAGKFPQVEDADSRESLRPYEIQLKIVDAPCSSDSTSRSQHSHGRPHTRQVLLPTEIRESQTDASARSRRVDGSSMTLAGTCYDKRQTAIAHSSPLDRKPGMHPTPGSREAPCDPALVRARQATAARSQNSRGPRRAKFDAKQHRCAADGIRTTLRQTADKLAHPQTPARARAGPERNGHARIRAKHVTRRSHAKQHTGCGDATDGIGDALAETANTRRIDDTPPGDKSTPSRPRPPTILRQRTRRPGRRHHGATRRTDTQCLPPPARRPPHRGEYVTPSASTARHLTSRPACMRHAIRVHPCRADNVSPASLPSAFARTHPSRASAHRLHVVRVPSGSARRSARARNPRISGLLRETVSFSPTDPARRHSPQPQDYAQYLIRHPRELEIPHANVSAHVGIAADACACGPTPQSPMAAPAARRGAKIRGFWTEKCPPNDIAAGLSDPKKTGWKHRATRVKTPYYSARRSPRADSANLGRESSVQTPSWRGAFGTETKAFGTQKGRCCAAPERRNALWQRSPLAAGPRSMKFGPESGVQMAPRRRLGNTKKGRQHKLRRARAQQNTHRPHVRGHWAAPSTAHGPTLGYPMAAHAARRGAKFREFGPNFAFERHRRAAFGMHMDRLKPQQKGTGLCPAPRASHRRDALWQRAPLAAGQNPVDLGLQFSRKMDRVEDGDGEAMILPSRTQRQAVRAAATIANTARRAMLAAPSSMALTSAPSWCVRIAVRAPPIRNGVRIAASPLDVNRQC
ncbi:hypothetical protein EVG20_g10627 [Dentipellis fragilis]|uniref:Uncharacterized protein n=1 Tax=Dentipellis fragilis TaxID=205917 RepID=A0A4Y9XS91_9AGAM|nr:hypothetical protein EVG20_g10627 [Dentipellis fragilis]